MGRGILVSPYPNGKTFAFTIIDDTDGATLKTVRTVYEFLSSSGFRTTKTVWVLPSRESPTDARDMGETLEDPEYRRYHLSLRERGFEIALHNVSSRSNTRDRILLGLERFREILGEDPKINVHHEKNAENIHFDWAQNPSILPERFHGRVFEPFNARSRKLDATRTYRALHGQDPGSGYFWGDVCRERIRYVRTNIFFDSLNTLKCNPSIPYSLPQTPFVKHWFDSSNGQDPPAFNRILSPGNIRKLKAEWGCCILYTHFGKGFVDPSGGGWSLNPETRERLREVGGDPDGWYAPVGEILDRLLRFRNVSFREFQGGSFILNGNPEPIGDVTIVVNPGRSLWEGSGKRHRADDKGRIRMDSLPPGGTMLLEREPGEDGRYWRDRNRPLLATDAEEFLGRLGARVNRGKRVAGG